MLNVKMTDVEKWEVLEDFTPPLFPDITIPKGYTFDGASIPRVLTPFINNADYGVLDSAVVHDWLYGTKGRFNNIELTRKQVDNIFLRHLIHYKIPMFTAYVSYWAVRMAGKQYWGGKK